MSNFYLCDRCLGNLAKWPSRRSDIPSDRCDCDWYGLIRKKVMVDHNGVGGIRYANPLHVCRFFIGEDFDERDQGVDNE